MAKTTRLTAFTPEQAARLVRAADLVLRDGGASANAGPAGESVGADGSWLKITGSTLLSGFAPWRWLYTVDVHRSPLSTTPLSTGATAFNVIEIGNTSGERSGYTVVTSGAVCGDVTGILPAPTGHWFRCHGRAWDDAYSAWRLLFDWPNIPVVQGAVS
jgi:hypothetical protein